MEKLDEIQWKSPEFIQERGLNTGNVLEYFALSPFYDRTSNNQVLMMQFQYQQIQLPVHMNFHQYFQSRLSEMTGVEFVIAFVREPDFWIIRKQKRLNQQHTFTLQDYYIIGANVYQAPKIYDVLSGRLLANILSVKQSMKTLSKMTSYHISDGGHSFNNSLHEKNRAQNQVHSSKQTNTTLDNLPITTDTPISITDSPAIGQPSNTPTNAPQFTTNTISSGAFNSLLDEITNESSNEFYLDDIPLYGKGSTVEFLNLKTNT
ncbi:MED6 [Candida pseudojiufengensis]|uniref:MED6 n=1 Tax=Candida pseudojiufengensis TaxID=497109 RepID=UPI002224501E|nr:MED6 [Candida pseudojiufengensis]KAI5967838.1 MED6 [Candida pseudojiufengensis]